AEADAAPEILLNLRQGDIDDQRIGGLDGRCHHQPAGRDQTIGARRKLYRTRRPVLLFRGNIRHRRARTVIAAASVPAVEKARNDSSSLYPEATLMAVRPDPRQGREEGGERATDNDVDHSG